MENLPHAIKRTIEGDRLYDLPSLLLKSRKIFLFDEIDDVSAESVILQMMYLNEDNPKKEIQLFINSPGGSVLDGLAIYDTMKLIEAPVSTICVGLCASMGSFLLLSGAAGRRFSLPHARIMLHQPSGETWGQSSDIEIYTEEMVKLRKSLYEIISLHTGKCFDDIKKHYDRNKWMSAEESIEQRVIDSILQSF